MGPARIRDGESTKIERIEQRGSVIPTTILSPLMTSRRTSVRMTAGNCRNLPRPGRMTAFHYSRVTRAGDPTEHIVITPRRYVHAGKR